jgi:ribosome-binding protein aMBF1 (putative translation factor)
MASVKYPIVAEHDNARKSIAQAIAKAIKESGISQAEFARKSNVHPSVLNRILKLKMSASERQIKRMEKVSQEMRRKAKRSAAAKAKRARPVPAKS